MENISLNPIDGSDGAQTLIHIIMSREGKIIGKHGINLNTVDAEQTECAGGRETEEDVGDSSVIREFGRFLLLSKRGRLDSGRPNPEPVQKVTTTNIVRNINSVPRVV